MELTALNCNGNPLHADPEARAHYAQAVFDAIELAALLGVKRVITMSGLPGVDASSTLPGWTPLPWESTYLEARDYQWDEVAVPFWKQVQDRAADSDVLVAIELYPHNVVYNPRTMLRLADRIGATHVGAEMDPSHLMWQGIDPVRAIDALGELVYIAAAKDIRVNDATLVNGVLDDGFEAIAEDEPGYLPLGGRFAISRWPSDSSWDFVAVGRGHDVGYRTEFLRALRRVDSDMVVNIEHEDVELGQVEDLEYACRTVLDAVAAL